MRVSYDQESRGLLIRFRDGTYVESEEIVPGVVVDFDRSGRAIGLELEDVQGLIDGVSLQRALRPHVKTGVDLREFRAAWGLTQRQLASALGIPTNTIARWERSEVRIEKPLMLDLALHGLFTAAAQTKAAPNRKRRVREGGSASRRAAPRRSTREMRKPHVKSASRKGKSITAPAAPAGTPGKSVRSRGPGRSK